MVSGISRNVVKIRLIRLGSCRSAIELRPQTINDISELQSAILISPSSRGSDQILYRFCNAPETPQGPTYRCTEKQIASGGTTAHAIHFAQRRTVCFCSTRKHRRSTFSLMIATRQGGQQWSFEYKIQLAI